MIKQTVRERGKGRSRRDKGERSAKRIRLNFGWNGERIPNKTKKKVIVYKTTWRGRFWVTQGRE